MGTAKKTNRNESIFRKELQSSVENIMKEFNRPLDEIAFEKSNIINFYDSCKKATIDDLRNKESFLLGNLNSAWRSGDMAYFSCRNIFLNVVYRFLPRNDSDVPF